MNRCLIIDRKFLTWIQSSLYLATFRNFVSTLLVIYYTVLYYSSITLTINIVITLLRVIGIILIGYYAVIYYYALAMTVFMRRRNKSRSVANY